ncbi:MAG: ABC transporter substrate-binding protein [Desulfuromonadales bacterium]
MKKRFVMLCSVLILLSLTSMTFAEEKLMIYTSMKESMMGRLRDAFKKKYPDIKMDYYSAGAGKLMAKIATERQSGKLAADMLWHSEVPDFFQLKDQGVLEKYVSPEAKNVKSTVTDPDGYFIPARLGTLGIVYNTKKVKTPPRDWSDLTSPEFKNAFGIANPSLSGTSFMSIAMIVNTFGWEFIQKLKDNGAKMGHGSGQVVDDTASGDYKGSIGVDYIAEDKIRKGANLAIVFPREMLVIPSPVAIFKGTPNVNAARKFVDFLLSKEGQTIVAASGTLPIRSDVPIPKDIGLMSPADAVKQAMKLDYLKTMNEKESIIKRFEKMMR